MADQNSDSDEDWDTLGDWNEAPDPSTPTVEGVVAPALRETAISPTTSWDEDDEPWPTASTNTSPALRGASAPRAFLGSWGEGVAGGIEDDPHEARLPRPPAEGVVSPTVIADREVGETFAWAPDGWGEAGKGASSTRGVGRPRSEVERLEELRKVGRDPFKDIMPEGEEWADDAQGWLVQPREQTPPLAEGVLSLSAASRPMASTFNLGEGTEEALEATAGRGIGMPRSEQERLEMVRGGGEDEEWARSAQGFDLEEMQRQVPEEEGVLGEGPREDGAFAENFGWEGELGEEWGPQERTVPPGRGAGAPVPPAVRRQQERLPMTAYELELLQNMVRFVSYKNK